MNWRLCNVCCSTLGPYLPPRVPAGPGFSSSGNESDLDPSLKYVLPFNTSGWAIAAGYAGLFAVLVFPAPIALILGIVALYDISNKRKRGQKINGKGRAIFATIMGGLFTLVL